MASTETDGKYQNKLALKLRVWCLKAAGCFILLIFLVSFLTYNYEIKMGLIFVFLGGVILSFVTYLATLLFGFAQFSVRTILALVFSGGLFVALIIHAGNKTILGLGILGAVLWVIVALSMLLISVSRRDAQEGTHPFMAYSDEKETE